VVIRFNHTSVHIVRTVACIALAGILVLNQSTLGLALCIESQGHIRLEPAELGSCCDVVAAMEHRDEDQHLEEDRCGACIDIVVEGEFVSIRPRSAGDDVDDIVFSDHTLSFALSAFAAERGDSHLISKVRCQPPPALNVLCTVVLQL